MTNPEWFRTAFGSEYNSLYAHRDEAEAIAAVDLICRATGLAAGSRVLDAPCGAGRHARAFAAREMQVVGIDLSLDLLQAAQSARSDLPGIQPTYLRCDIRHLPFQLRRFHLVTNLFSSFGYFETDEENADVLLGLASQLKLGGHLALDFMHAAHVRTNLQPQSSRTTAEGWQVDETRFITPTPARVNKRILARNKHGEEREFLESVRLFEPTELEEMMQRNGLVISHRFGSYAGEDFTARSARIILIGKLQ